MKFLLVDVEYACNDKTMEHVDVMMMSIDKLERAAYRALGNDVY